MLPRELLCLFLLFIGALPATASEPWADPRLSEQARTGLVCWLDASRQNDARQFRKLAPLPDQGPMDVCFDASGNQRHFLQGLRDAQPIFRLLDHNASIRFNGQTHFLSCNHKPLQLKETTIFIVGAVNTNAGMFRAFLATHSHNRNDYQSGLNIDLGAQPGTRWDMVNVEGAGCPGQRNLLNEPLPFAQFARLCLTSQEGKAGASLFINGQPTGNRDRAAGPIHADHWTLGARIYSNEPRPPYVQGFLDGEIAEVLIFDRVLSDADRQAIDQYLHSKYQHATPSIRLDQGVGQVRLETVAKPPMVQMLVPGFSVHALPIDLPNINNLRYRPDGVLVALTYDGKILLLRDTNGDGLEDRADLFFDGKLRAPIGMALTPPGYAKGQGVFVASKGKVSLIVDTNGDDKADKEIIIAQGWKELPHGVDVLGVAVDAQGAIYFGFGSADYTNAYQLNATGQTQYQLQSERGAIVKLSPDFKTREIIATGIRFPVGMMFNHQGDLFATDQEGATWLPNGNPFDELLHIQPGRHYGFPPRHPKHLPNVIDEPSLFDYAPQHQSTCGLCFNGTKPGEPTFGPESWRGDVFIAGYARGKLYRTQLIKTPEGYLARNHLLACLQMLTVDCCVTPKNHLLVSTHSGPPDWGTGPGGKGKLFHIRYSAPSAPQPILVQCTSPREVRIGFDKPLDLSQLRELSKQIKIEYGPYVYPGDRYETLRPGYAAVQQQLASPRFALPIYSVRISPDQRTIILSTAPHVRSDKYEITLPRLSQDAPQPGELPQHSTIELAYDLCGVAAGWTGEDKDKTWSGVLPHLDSQIANPWTTDSSEHAALGPLLHQPGKLHLRTQLDLAQMLRPALQPGSTLDHTWPPEQVTIEIKSNMPIEVSCPQARIHLLPVSAGLHRVRLEITPQEGSWLPLELHVTTGKESPQLSMTYHTNEDARPRAFPLHRFRLPWARPSRHKEELSSFATLNPQLAQGNWSRGKSLFFGEANCYKCHIVQGQGAKIGPDLSNLIHRDYDSVLRDLQSPSATINPDYITSLVVLNDGRTLTGLVQASGPDHFTLTAADTVTATFRKDQIEEMAVSKVSLMPDGIDKQLGSQKLIDLMSFLLRPPPQPARLELPGAPPPRTLTEVQSILSRSPPISGPKRPLRILLCAGPKDHGPGEHDYPLWQRRWLDLLSMADGVTVEAVQVWPTTELLAKTDVLVCYSNNPGWSAARAKELGGYLQRGGGLVLIHYAVDGHRAVEDYAKLIGLAWRGGASKFRHGPLHLTFPDQTHPITKAFPPLSLVDESYWNLVGSPKDIHILATGPEEGKPQPLLWTKTVGKGRVFVSIPGHYTWSFDDPLFRLLLLRGIAWTAGEPVGRFQDLATIGARIEPTKP